MPALKTFACIEQKTRTNKRKPKTKTKRTIRNSLFFFFFGGGGGGEEGCGRGGGLCSFKQDDYMKAKHISSEPSKHK